MYVHQRHEVICRECRGQAIRVAKIKKRLLIVKSESSDFNSSSKLPYSSPSYDNKYKYNLVGTEILTYRYLLERNLRN